MARELAVSPLQLGLLQALHTYRLLTYDMMRQAGVARDRATVGDAARYLHRHGLIGRNAGALVSGVTALPDVFWLTPRGAAALHQLDGTPAVGAERTFGETHEILHRLGIVAIHLALRGWAAAAGAEVVSYTTDFEPGSAGRQKATRIDGPGFVFVPDAIAWVRLSGEHEARLLVVELERGGERGDLTRFFSARSNHGKLTLLRTVAGSCYLERAFGTPERPLARPALLVVFKDEALRQSALARWRVPRFEPDSPDWHGVFVKSLPEVAADFGTSWHQPDGTIRPLFERLPAMA